MVDPQLHWSNSRSLPIKIDYVYYNCSIFTDHFYIVKKNKFVRSNHDKCSKAWDYFFQHNHGFKDCLPKQSKDNVVIY